MVRLRRGRRGREEDAEGEKRTERREGDIVVFRIAVRPMVRTG